ncbi:MAG: 16S rRNA (uracil(1498)-N(3))-methyltransferase [Desulfuromonadales bacterium]
MLRFFVPTEVLAAEEFPLPEDIRHHLGTVLRRPAGEEILLLDGTGTIGRCRVEHLDRRSGTARLLQRWREEETAFPVTLLQSLPKGDKMDLVLQKGTELGIAAFVPVATERSIPALTGERETTRQQRWQRIVREAARQCRRPVLPHLAPPQPLATALSACRQELRLFFWEEESRPLTAILPRARPVDAAVLIGPEGGFSADEAAAVQAAGFLPVHFGPRILRSETAGFAVNSILQFLYGNLDLPPARELP